MKTIKEDYKIDKNVPMPGIGSLGSYPWNRMDVGDSFLLKTRRQVPLVHSPGSLANNTGGNFQLALSMMGLGFGGLNE